MSDSGLNVWFQEDIRQAIQSVRIANQEALEAMGLTLPNEVIIQPGERLDVISYWKGVEATLLAFAAAFGVDGDLMRR